MSIDSGMSEALAALDLPLDGPPARVKLNTPWNAPQRYPDGLLRTWHRIDDRVVFVRQTLVFCAGAGPAVVWTAAVHDMPVAGGDGQLSFATQAEAMAAADVAGSSFDAYMDTLTLGEPE